MYEEDEVSQAERKRAMENDRKVIATYHSFAAGEISEDRGGRFATLEKPTITGATLGSAFPQLPADNPFAKNELPDEPLIDGRGEGVTTGYEIDRLDASTVAASTEEAASDAPKSSHVITGRVARKFKRRV